MSGPYADPTISTVSHYPNTIPLFPFQPHFPLFNPTIIILIPLFAHQSHSFGCIFIIPLLLFLYRLLAGHLEKQKEKKWARLAAWHAVSGDERRTRRDLLKRSTRVWPFEPLSVPTKRFCMGWMGLLLFDQTGVAVVIRVGDGTVLRRDGRFIRRYVEASAQHSNSQRAHFLLSSHRRLSLQK